MRRELSSAALFALVAGCSSGSGGEQTPADGASPPPADALGDAMASGADATPDADSGPPADAAPPVLGDVSPPPDDAPAPPVEPWAPAPGPWVGFPAHPFRSWLPDAGVYDVMVASPGGGPIVAAGEQGLALFEVDEQGLGRQLAHLETDRPFADLALSSDGRRAALATAAGVSFVDLTDPREPVLRGTFELREAVNAVALSPDGRTAHATTTSALHVIDAQDPAVPTRLGTLDVPSLRNVVVAPDGLTAFASDLEGLVVLDVTTPAAPAVVGRFALEGDVQELVVSADGATVLAARWLGVTVVDVRDRAAPAVLGRIEHPRIGHVRTVVPSADAQSLFVAEGGLLRVIDVRDPAAPGLVASFEVAGSIRGLGLAGPERAFVATSAGVMLLDLRHPPVFPLVGGLEAEAVWCARLADVQRSPDGRTAFVAGGENIMAIDVGDPRAPALLLAADVGAKNLALTANGATLLAAGGGSLSLYDAATLAPRAQFGEPSATPMDVVVSSDGATAYLATEGGGGLDIVGLAEPGAPALLGQLYIRHTVSLVLSADEQTVFVADPYENGLVAIDVRDPGAPVFRGRLPQQVHEVSLSPDGTTLAATTPGGVILVDVRNVDDLRLVSTFEGAPGLGDVWFTADGRSLVVADGTGGVKVADVSEPAAPWLVGAFDTPGDPVDLAPSPNDDGAVVIAENGSPCVGVVDLGGRPSLEPEDAPAEGVRRHRLRWTDRYPEHPEQIAWHATSGEVVISGVDQVEHTALVDWTLPAEAADGAVLSVAVGNHHLYQVARVKGAGR